MTAEETRKLLEKVNAQVYEALQEVAAVYIGDEGWGPNHPIVVAYEELWQTYVRIAKAVEQEC